MKRLVIRDVRRRKSFVKCKETGKMVQNSAFYTLRQALYAVFLLDTLYLCIIKPRKMDIDNEKSD